MNGLGTCAYCTEPAVVRVQNTAACQQHIDTVMRDVFLPIREAVRRSNQHE